TFRKASHGASNKLGLPSAWFDQTPLPVRSPVSAALMVEPRFSATHAVDHLSIAKYLATAYPRLDRPSGQRGPVPRAPTTFRKLIFMPHYYRAVQVHKDKVSVVAFDNPPLVDNVPHARRRVAHPMHHFEQRTS